MGLPKCVIGRPMWRRTEPNEGPHLDPPDLTRWHTLCPHVSLSSHTHTYQHKHHTQKIYAPGASIHSPLHIHTQGNLSPWCHIHLSLSRPLSFLVLSLPRRPPVGPSIHASLEYIHIPSLDPAKYVTYTFTHVTSLHVPHWSKKRSLHVYFA